MTLGYEPAQREKVRRNGLDGFFHDEANSLYIVDRSKGPAMEKIARLGGPTMMVGDSWPRDMEPAIELGLTAVWKHNTDIWSAPTGEPAGHYAAFQHLHQLPAIVERWKLTHPKTPR